MIRSSPPGTRTNDDSGGADLGAAEGNRWIFLRTDLWDAQEPAPDSNLLTEWLHLYLKGDPVPWIVSARQKLGREAIGVRCHRNQNGGEVSRFILRYRRTTSQQVRVLLVSLGCTAGDFGWLMGQDAERFLRSARIE